MEHVPRDTIHSEVISRSANRTESVDPAPFDRDRFAVVLKGEEWNEDREVLTGATAHRESYRAAFEELFLRAALSNAERGRDGVWRHPIIAVNALKNLASLRLATPSFPLLEVAAQLVMLAPVSARPAPEQIPPDLLSQPLFVRDLQRALELGDSEGARLELGLLLSLSDNRMVAMDLLLEAAAHAFPAAGLIGYAAHRGASFCANSDAAPLAEMIVSALAQERPAVRTTGEKLIEEFPATFAEELAQEGDETDLILLAGAHRAWHVESMRRVGVREGILRWIAGEYVENGGAVRRRNGRREERAKGIGSAEGGEQIMAIAEEMAARGADGEQFLLLDSIHYLSRHVSPESSEALRIRADLMRDEALATK